MRGKSASAGRCCTTHAGWVRLQVLADPPWVDIEVTDTGVGIAPDQLQLIGEEFYQVGVPSNSTREGYGLGVSIVRRLVRLLAVELQVRSEPGKGSVFSVRLREALGGTLKAVLITGDTSSAVKDLSRDPNLRIVSKPVQAETFLVLVRDLLAA